MNHRLFLCVFAVFLSSPLIVNAQLAIGAGCESNPTGCPNSAVCQMVTKVCKLSTDPCGAPNPCDTIIKMDASKAAFKFCVPSASSTRGFDCLKETTAPTPFPTPAAPTPPTPMPPDDPGGDVCKDEVPCKAADVGVLAGCICLPSGLCQGNDAASGMVLGCNRASNRCAPCVPGNLFCACVNGNSCSVAGLVCETGQCMPGAGFSLPCSSPGSVGCPCLGTPCKPQFACSSQLSRCISCPVGCKEKCAQASVGINDTCAGLSASCMDCKASGTKCAWCGTGVGCRTMVCPDGGTGDAACASCAGRSECNGGGECIGPDVCKCSRGFIDDSTLGCKPEDAVPTEAPSGNNDIAIYAGAGAGAALLIIVVVVVIVVLRKKKGGSSNNYATVMSPVASTNMDNQPAVGMFNCNICGKSYNFQSDLETHTTMRHGSGGGGETFAGNQQGGFSNDGFNTVAIGGTMNNGQQTAFSQDYQSQQFGGQQQFNNNGGSIGGWNDAASHHQW